MVQFLCWHVLELEFWHFAHPELNLRFVLASVLRCFLTKKCDSTVQKEAELSISRRFFGVFLCVAFRIVFFDLFFTAFLPKLDFWHLYFSSVQGKGGGGERGGGW